MRSKTGSRDAWDSILFLLEQLTGLVSGLRSRPCRGSGGAAAPYRPGVGPPFHPADAHWGQDEAHCQHAPFEAIRGF
jgi:hypothetical protein